MDGCLDNMPQEVYLYLLKLNSYITLLRIIINLDMHITFIILVRQYNMFDRSWFYQKTGNCVFRIAQPIHYLKTRKV